MNLYRLFAAVCLAVLPLACTAVNVQILEPTKNSSLEVAIVICPGADLDGLRYKPLAEKIQKLYTGRLWIALLHDFVFNTPNPVSLKMGFNDAVSKLKASGFSGDNVYLAGHSLGGVFVSMFGESNPDKLKGVMLFAAYLTRDHKLRDYPVPLMTLSGDLDGLTRVTRIVDTFEELENETINNPSPMSLMYTRPVIVMQGMNHGHFASGEMPSNVANHDIEVDHDITFDSGYETIAYHVINFLTVNLRQPNDEFLTAVQWMKVAFHSTQEIIKPLSMIKALDTNPEKVSHTTSELQSVLLGDQLASHVQVNNTEISESNTAFYEPEVTVHVDNAHVQTFASVVMPFNPEDVSESPQTPSELIAIMKSFSGMHAILKTVQVDTMVNLSCRELNQHILAIAMNASSDVAKERASKRDSPKVTFHEDKVENSMVEWFASSLDLKYGDKGELEVTSSSYVTSVGSDPSSKAAGVMYCKLMSPYRAMEWFYLDSLKRTSSHKFSIFG